MVDQDAIVQFMEITGADHGEAVSLLEAADYNLDHAMALYFAKNEQHTSTDAAADPFAGLAAEEEVRAPLPVRTERLVGPTPTYHQRPLVPPPQLSNPFRNFGGEADDNGGAGLGDLFKPPKDLLFPLSIASLDEAIDACLKNNKWLMVNIQANDTFASHQLNRDTWSDPAVGEIVKNNFVFVQIMAESGFGQSVCGAYRVTETPIIMVVDPETRAKVKQWTGFLAPDRLVEELIPFLEHSFSDIGASSLARTVHQKSSTAAANPTRTTTANTPAGGGTDGRHDGNGTTTMSAAAGVDHMTEEEQLAMALAMSAQDPPAATQPSSTHPSQHVDRGHAGHHGIPSTTPAPAGEGAGAGCGVSVPQVQQEAAEKVPEEPAEGTEGVCRVGFRLPDGQRLQRRFLLSAPVQVLYDFCLSKNEEAAGGRPFALADSMPGSKALDDKSQTLEAANVANAMLMLRWRD